VSARRSRKRTLSPLKVRHARAANLSSISSANEMLAAVASVVMPTSSFASAHGQAARATNHQTRAPTGQISARWRQRYPSPE
jgi:hypothetical protein